MREMKYMIRVHFVGFKELLAIFTEGLRGFPQFFQPVVARIIHYNITVSFQIFVIYYSVKVMVNFTLEKP